MNTFQRRSHTSPVTKRTSSFGRYAALLGTCAVLSQTRLPAAPLDLLQPAKEAAVQVIPSQKIENTIPPQMTMSIAHKDILAILGLGGVISAFNFQRKKCNAVGFITLSLGGTLLGQLGVAWSTAGMAAGVLLGAYVIGTGAGAIVNSRNS